MDVLGAKLAEQRAYIDYLDNKRKEMDTRSEDQYSNSEQPEG